MVIPAVLPALTLLGFTGGGGARTDSVRSAADSTVGAITKGVDAIFHEPSKLNYLLLHGGLFILLTIILVLAIKLSNRFFVRLHGFVRSNRGTIIKPIKLKDLELVSLDQLVSMAFKSVRVFRWVFIILLFYLYLTLAFSLFLWTEMVAHSLLGYVLGPLVAIGKGAVSYLPNIFYIVVVAVVARYALKLMKLIFSKIEDKTISVPGFPEEWARPTYQIAAFLLIVFVLVIVFPYLPGAESGAAKGISIFLALLLSLGSSSAVSNIVAGVVITYMRSFRLGDRVKINEIVGDIMEHNFLVTRVKTTKNEEITIPNSVVLSGHVTNYSAVVRDGHPLILYTSVTIGYDTPWTKIHELLIAAALATPRILHNPKPFVLQTALGDFYVSYQINAYTNAPSDMPAIYSALHQNIQDSFFKAGVEIASPHYYSLRDGNRKAIPDSFLEDGYTTPPFKVRMEPDSPKRKS
jgi:small-conductance mechanosensitive channel